MDIERSTLDTILTALAERLALVGAPALELVAVGGAALNVLGLVERTTKDVDLVATAVTDADGDLSLVKLDALPAFLAEQASVVAQVLKLPKNWLNPGPANLMDFGGLPAGFAGRLVTRRYGESLVMHFAGRVDQIHFKLYGAVDQGPGQHFLDLKLLAPTAAELEQAARWAMTHDDSLDFISELKGMLKDLGHADLADRL